ncbi:TPA: hypothetical protein QH074_004326 [Enterobacter hormaechei subsp. steigerwaltii]|nr:hypothetical protein [Enterobacter hormaechei subsp. steigerwaltii]
MPDVLKLVCAGAWRFAVGVSSHMAVSIVSGSLLIWLALWFSIGSPAGSTLHMGDADWLAYMLTGLIGLGVLAVAYSMVAVMLIRLAVVLIEWNEIAKR